MNIQDEPRSGLPVSVTHEKHQKEMDELTQNDRCVTQQCIATEIGILKERVGHIIA